MEIIIGIGTYIITATSALVTHNGSAAAGFISAGIRALRAVYLRTVKRMLRAKLVPYFMCYQQYPTGEPNVVNTAPTSPFLRVSANNT